MQDNIFDYYRKPGNVTSIATGGMVGGGFFKTLTRYALPLLKSIGERVLRVAARTAQDMVGHRRSLGEALLQHGTRELVDAAPSEINKISQTRKRKRALDIFSSLKQRKLK